MEITVQHIDRGSSLGGQEEVILFLASGSLLPDLGYCISSDGLSFYTHRMEGKSLFQLVIGDLCSFEIQNQTVSCHGELFHIYQGIDHRSISLLVRIIIAVTNHHDQKVS